MEGQFVEKNKVVYIAPNPICKLSWTEEFNIETSINGSEDYTNNKNNNYNNTYYDPFCIKSRPQKFPLGAAIYNDDFTNNKVSVFYYEDPTIKVI